MEQALRSAVTESARGHRNGAQAMAIYVCRRLAGMKLEEIAQIFGVGGYWAVSSVIGRPQAELALIETMARGHLNISELSSEARSRSVKSRLDPFFFSFDRFLTRPIHVSG